MRSTLSFSTVLALLRQNGFPLPGEAHDRSDGAMMVVAFRGLAPHSRGVWGTEHDVTLVTTDNVHMRCTYALVDTEKEELMLFLGSTVPHRSYIGKALKRKGLGANEQVTGATVVVEGRHPYSGRTSHRALRQAVPNVHRRTADDYDYDGDDRVEGGSVADNVHAGWNHGYDHAYFASAGCGNIQGYPACAARPGQPATGDWARFDAEIFGPRARHKAQTKYAHVILSGYDAVRMGATPPATVSARVRQGSVGPVASAVQQAMADRGFYDGDVDGLFYVESTLALGKFQEDAFGSDADDYICGPNTGRVLGITRWPRVPTAR